ncbi:uncharacterized protein LACBIDRAFT_323302 [Laccaria bicolor S238N-H82]|uniref:Predicted protein n=1 Tax=Laccaria bicolor (strain S238N-H82 / ATCC MYA-4686) TaxID=486041 RepID=B0CZS4_LACBS|nr:uncharacterized protein LACBIDRAFT_323302 [Laccaria bicolor S238N-H82]EDR12203.1 predicted protein [Laccaria bicolor S238N-H82]|eukprot:XP_001876467.1 predicted protein [Laccaria bicolor S238N-H82]
MPIIDTRPGVYTKDKKPIRYYYLPTLTHVRIEKSKECQKSDWKLHKQGCRTPRFVDIGSWVKAYEWLIEWAAKEALQIHTHPDKILTHCLVINVFAVERVVGPIASPFLIVNAQVLDTTKETLTQENDVEASLAIRESGGIGQAQVLIEYHTLGGIDLTGLRDRSTQLAGLDILAPGGTLVTVLVEKGKSKSAGDALRKKAVWLAGGRCNWLVWRQYLQV